jgi:hypothetical protein
MSGRSGTSVALFAIIMGIALLLAGIGLLVLTVRWLREPESAARATPVASPVKPAVA